MPQSRRGFMACATNRHAQWTTTTMTLTELYPKAHSFPTMVNSTRTQGKAGTGDRCPSFSTRRGCSHVCKLYKVVSVAYIHIHILLLLAIVRFPLSCCTGPQTQTDRTEISTNLHRGSITPARRHDSVWPVYEQTPSFVQQFTPLKEGYGGGAGCKNSDRWIYRVP